MRDLPPIGKLPDIDAAAQRVVRAILQGETVGLLLDHDADGVTAGAVLWTVMTENFGFPAGKLHAVLSHRIQEGYGVSDKLVDRILALDPMPSLVITADQGSCDQPRIERLRAAGIETIVSDHHLVPDEGVPTDALACINPARGDSAFEDRTIAGCMVAWCLMVAVGRLLAEAGHPVRGSMQTALQFVGLGTLADCVDLGASRMNRFAVQTALARMRTSDLPIWRAFAAKSRGQIDSASVAFQWIPRINAAGRMRDASQALAALCSRDDMIATAWVEELDAANRSRKESQAALTERAMAMAEEIVAGGARALCLPFYVDGHAGVHGIVAARVVEATGLPTVCLSMAAEPEHWMTGSIRSIEGAHAKDALDAIAAQYPHLQIKYGGHAFAAGVRMPVQSVPEFALVWEEAIGAALAGKPASPLRHDGPLGQPPSREAVQEIQALEPFGKGFPMPVFCDQVEVLRIRPLKAGSQHMSLDVAFPGGVTHRMVWFGCLDADGRAPIQPGFHTLGYELAASTYKRGPGFDLIVRQAIGLEPR
ncbi:single-stranded-DNA-specific exonuclease RecJ [mine drainage metagenome]|uniref:Single-stranded-DNA-specific exonuclease RecJ n=5 Tax=mine drainage metagenome TaxID=410659 RepID=T1BGY7_9ZZZZ